MWKWKWTRSINSALEGVPTAEIAGKIAVRNFVNSPHWLSSPTLVHPLSESLTEKLGCDAMIGEDVES